MARPLLGQVTDLDLRLLRVFRTVVECGGFAAAELELNVGRSTISKQIKDLEIRLGMRLCRRGRGGFALSPEGTQIYQATLRVLGAISDLRSEIYDLHRHLSGQLQFALFDKTATNPACRIPRAIGWLRERAPDVAVEIRVLPMNEIERGVIEGDFHVGVIPTHRRSEACDYHPLFAERMFLYCGAGHTLFDRLPPRADSRSVSVEDVRKMPFAGLGFHSHNTEQGHALGLQRNATAYDQEGVATLILSGAYLGFLPDHYAEGFVSAGLMRPVLPGVFTYECHFEAMARPGAQRTRLTQTFLDLLIEAHR